MNKNTNYYATDRDIFEALSSKRKKFTKDLLIELCNDRGILVSDSLSRESLIEYLSMLPHDYHDFDYLSRLIESNSKSEKLTYDDVPIEISNDDVKKNITAVSEKREKYGENYSVVVESENKTVVKVEYTEMDYSMTRLRQRKPKEAFIEVIKEDGTTKIRRPSNDRVNKIVDEIFCNVKDEKGKVVEKQNISLTNITDSRMRTRFFTDLISSLDDLNLHDVKYIKVDNLSTHSESSISDDDEEKEMAAQEILSYVKKAALDGEGLLQSEEYQNLADSGFFISSIVWQAIEDKKDGRKIEFEASFDNPFSCTGFKYNIRGYYNCNEGTYTKTKRPFEDHQKTSFFKEIEKQAKTIIDAINSDLEAD